MKDSRFILLGALVLIIQLILTKYGQIGPYIYISLLPVLILRMPTSWPTWLVILLAFFCGLLTDGMSDGPLGLNAAALVPVGALQKPILRWCFDDDAVDRGYGFSARKNGYLTVLGAISIVVLLYFTVYMLCDCAGVRSFGFIASKLLISSALSIIAGSIACSVLYTRN